MSDVSLRAAYSVWALGYDVFLGSTTSRARRRSVELLALRAGERVLLVGVGTGLDLPHLPRHSRYQAVDLTPAMLRRAGRRAAQLDLPIALAEASASVLPFEDEGFDAVILHLILAVVPDPAAALREVARVLRPGGRAVIWDKKLMEGRRPTLIRRAVHALTHRHLTGFLFDLDATLEAAPALRITHREPSIFGGMWQVVLLDKLSAVSHQPSVVRSSDG
jgi:phosphatidylethanolamine/phosphatidyl-N-methylethanolamine N-methyltransferase